MHKRVVLNIVSRVLFIVCAVMLIPLAWGLALNPRHQEISAFVVTILVGALLCMATRHFFQLNKNDLKKLNVKDGLAIVGLSWICLSVFGALPLYLGGAVTSFTDGIFEIASGFTTTGASIMTDIESLPKGILFWRSLTHWLGGMGIIVLYVALLPALGPNAYQLYKAEAPGLMAERVQPRIKETAKILWSVYFLLSFAEVILLKWGGMTFYDALCHTFGTMATGGFSTKTASIGFYGAHIQWIVIIFMFLAGANFMLHYQVLKGDIRAYWKSEEFRVYLWLVIAAIGIFSFVLFRNNYEGDIMRDAAFQSVSILTTTGYATANSDLWPNVLRFGLITLMFIGGCGGSTGGGMKVIRALLSFKIAVRSIVRSVFPNAILPVKFDRRSLSERLITAVSAYFMIFIGLFFIGVILLTITEKSDLVTLMSASVACLSNIGPGLGGIGTTGNYAWMTLPGKWVLIFLMLAGRLELYSILILFLPTAWRK